MKKLLSFLKKYPLLSIFFITITLITAALLITALSLQDTTEIEIRVAPASASVFIDNKLYGNGTFRISSGIHHIKIEKEGFISKEFTFDTATSNKLYTYLLEPNNSYNWYLTHSDDALLLTSIGDYESTLISDAFNSKYPIMASLPIIYAHYDEQYDYTEFRIDGGELAECDNHFCLKITDTTGGNYELAKQKIIDAGFNPDDYQIIYEYTPINPL